MSPDGPPPPPPPPPPPRNRGPLGPGGGSGGPVGPGGTGPLGPKGLVGPARWVLWGVAIAAGVLLLFAVNQGKQTGESYSYTKFLSQARAGHVHEISYDNSTGKITGKLDDKAKTEFRTTGLIPFPDD